MISLKDNLEIDDYLITLENLRHFIFSMIIKKKNFQKTISEKEW